MLEVIDLKKENSTVEYALAIVEIEIERAIFSGTKVIKVLHGYGSHGKGGAILLNLRKALSIWKRQGKIKDFFGGDRWNMSDHTALEILKSDKTIYNDEDFNKFNPGITIIVVN